MEIGGIATSCQTGQMTRLFRQADGGADGDGVGVAEFGAVGAVDAFPGGFAAVGGLGDGLEGVTLLDGVGGAGLDGAGGGGCGGGGTAAAGGAGGRGAAEGDAGGAGAAGGAAGGAGGAGGRE